MDDRTPAERPVPPDEADPLVGEIRRERRDRLALVIAAVVGIITGVAAGTAFTLGAFGDAARAMGPRNPGALIFFIGPPAICMAIGYAIYALLRRRR